jgi:hypothetical protein
VLLAFSVSFAWVLVNESQDRKMGLSTEKVVCDVAEAMNAKDRRIAERETREDLTP